MAAPSFKVGVSTNARNLARAFSDLAEKQIPFATAVALTRTAQDARTYIAGDASNRGRLEKYFELRGNRVAKGIRIERAKKTDWPNPVAKVGTVDDFIALQITGGEKKPQKGASHIAVPTKLVDRRRTAAGSIPKALKPRTLRDRADVYLKGAEIKRRMDKARGNASNLKTATFYNLVRKAEIPARFPFPKDVEISAGSTYEENFTREFDAAVRSARVRSGSFSSEQGRTFYLKARRKLGRIPV